MKRNIFKKIAALGLAATLSVGALSACGDDKSTVEEYEGQDILALYENNDKQFEFFAYRTLTDGYYYFDDREFFTRNQRTKEDYELYLEAGFTMLYLSPGYNGIDEWSTCETKKSWTEALAAGVDRIFFADGALASLIMSGEELVTQFPKTDENGKQTLDTDALLAEVKKRLSVYFNEPGFYGLNLGDEPSYKYAWSYGEVYKAVVKASKELTAEIGEANLKNAIGASGEIYLHVNFLPIDSGGLRSERFQTYKTDENGNEVLDENGNKVVLTFTESYTKYIEDYITAMEANRISVDIYYFRGVGISPGAYACVQILAELCKKYDIALSFCLQSFEMYSGQGTTPIYRKVDKSAMRMELESLIGFGVDHFAYYTYSPDVTSGSDSGDTRSIETSAFVNYKGEPNNVYYWGQEMMANAKKFEKVALSYKYQGARMYQTQTTATFGAGAYFASGVEPTSGTAIEFDNSHEFAKLKDVTFDNDVLFVSELKDEVNDKYMYLVQNCIDPINGQHGRTAETVTVDFGTEFTWVAEFNAGELTYVKLDGGKYTKTLSAGHGVFLIPLA